MTMKIEQQIAREQQMHRLGEKRAKDAMSRAVEQGLGAETPAGIALVKRAIEPLSEGIREFRAHSLTGATGRRSNAALLLADIDPELAAYVTVRGCIAAATKNYTLKSTALTIAGAIEAELIADRLEGENGALFRSIMRTAKSRGLNGERMAQAVTYSAKVFDVVEEGEKWTTGQKLQLGSKLIELVIEKLGIIEAPLVRHGQKSHHQIQFSDKIEEWFAKYNDAASLTRPLLLPSLVVPKPWDNVYGGSYYSPVMSGRSILSRSFPGQLDALKAADLAPVYKGLNALQETPWRINRKVLAVMREAWERDAGLACLPKREDEPIPTPPEEVQNDVRGGDIRREWRRKVRAIHDRNAKNRSTRYEFVRGLSVAIDNEFEERIYFPHRLDFRGRAYAAATSLNPQGSDDVRGLLEFAEGKALGGAGVWWLGIHGANLFGNDKVSMEERFRWAVDHIPHAMSVAADPLGDLWWTEADKPWCFLAWCFEWAAAQTETGHKPENYVSHLPVALDGSCNGIQHFSAMLRDPIGGAAVNLIPAEKPQDIYQTVADRVIERLKHHAENDADEDRWVAQSWLSFGINRKITKRAVMVLPYGGTFKSCMDYVREAVRDRISDGHENPFGDYLPKAEAMLASLVWASISDVVVAARETMDWLQKCARVATKANKPLKWTTPSGFVVCQQYQEAKDQRIKTNFCGSIVKFRSTDRADTLDRSKQVSAVSPNFVHSLDASAMMLTLGACVDAGLNSFAMIHDSYGTHAASTDLLAAILREEFVKMYEGTNVLARFREEVAASLTPEEAAELPPVPEYGTLDLRQVLEAAYFFA